MNEILEFSIRLLYYYTTITANIWQKTKTMTNNRQDN